MHRVMIVKIGSTKLHMLKIVGSFIVFGAALGALSELAKLFLLFKQFELAAQSAEYAMTVFGIIPNAMTNEVMLGFMMGPMGWFLLWLALFAIGTVIYRSGRIIVPIEEDDYEKK